MTQLTQNEHVDVLGLQSYLIKPLQRITKVYSVQSLQKMDVLFLTEKLNLTITIFSMDYW